MDEYIYHMKRPFGLGTFPKNITPVEVLPGTEPMIQNVIVTNVRISDEDVYKYELKLVQDPVYHKHGFKTRYEYLIHLSEVYGIHFDAVGALAHMLGESEDFDGLVSALEDYCY